MIFLLAGIPPHGSFGCSVDQVGKGGWSGWVAVVSTIRGKSAQRLIKINEQRCGNAGHGCGSILFVII